jgi:uncharacterized protein HemX
MADSKKSTRKKSSGNRPGSKKTAGKKAARKKTAKAAGSRLTHSSQTAAVGADNHTVESAVQQPHNRPHNNTTANAAPTTSTSSSSASEVRRSGSGSLAWISLLLAVVACAGVGLLLINKGVAYFSSPSASELTAAAVDDNPRLAKLERTQSEQQQQVQQVLSRVDSLQQNMSEQSAQQNRLKELEAALQDQSSDFTVTDKEQTSSINALQGQLQNQSRRMNELEASQAQLQAQQSDNEAEVQRQFVLLQLRQRLDEIGALLRTGRQQLLLNGNQQAALDAYDLAVRALQDLPAADGMIPATQLNELQQTLINERSQLASVNIPDMDNMIAELHGLADASQDWPLQNHHAEAGATTDTPDVAAGDSASSNDGVWQKLRGSLDHLVTVRNTEKPQLGIDEQLKLKRHLQLQLRTAALLALQQREDAWHNSLDSIDGFIQQWFVSDNRGVAAAQKRLHELGEIELKPDWPQPEQAMQLLAKMQASASLQRR